MNATSIPGQLLIGGMSDKLDLRVAISVSSIGAAVAVLFVWGFTGRGLGNVLRGRVSTLLLKHSPLYDTVKFGYGVKGYGPLILFTGFSMFASTFAATYPYFAGQPVGFNVPLSIISR
ncbi:hypothetical protein FRB90_003584 [Tulasnella sp. 427]|nr:hypothetical protein FRB90_003584 [Tulasnella sp. 427]